MKRGYKMLKDVLRVCPLAIPPKGITKNDTHIMNSILPDDFAFEIEATQLDITQIKGVYLKGVYERHDSKESRFRFHKQKNPLDTFKNLYDVCEFLYENYSFNSLSGIHYHINCPEIKKWGNLKGVKIMDNKRFEPILKELDSWGYQGSYNQRNIDCEVKRSWISIRLHLGTIEFRIGEMTFDYSLILKRISHCQQLTRKLVFLINEEIKKGKPVEKKKSDKFFNSSIDRFDIDPHYLTDPYGDILNFLLQQ